MANEHQNSDKPTHGNPRDKPPVHARDPNRDPISGTPGAHPVGVAVGGVAGGAAAGALAGTMFGPLGTLIGAGVGVLAGAALGKGVAERVDPTGENEYWRSEHQSRPYVKEEFDFDRDYSAAYGFGLQAREQYGNRGFEASENELREGWDRVRGDSRLEWNEARPAIRDSYERADLTYNTYAESDRYFESRFDQIDYREDGETFEDYRPAYRYGVSARTRIGDRQWDDALDEELRRDWERHRGSSKLTWERARNGVREAFNSTYFEYNSPYDDKSDFIDEGGNASRGMFRVR